MMTVVVDDCWAKITESRTLLDLAAALQDATAQKYVYIPLLLTSGSAPDTDGRTGEGRKDSSEAIKSLSLVSRMR